MKTVLWIVGLAAFTVGLAWLGVAQYEKDELRWIRAGRPTKNIYIGGNGPIEVWDREAVEESEAR